MRIGWRFIMWVLFAAGIVTSRTLNDKMEDYLYWPYVLFGLLMVWFGVYCAFVSRQIKKDEKLKEEERERATKRQSRLKTWLQKKTQSPIQNEPPTHERTYRQSRNRRG